MNAVLTKEIQDIRHRLERVNKSGRVLIITGPQGSGKTTAVRDGCLHLSKSKPQCNHALVECSPDARVYQVLQQILRTITDYGPGDWLDTDNTLLSARILRIAAEKKLTLLCVDFNGEPRHEVIRMLLELAKRSKQKNPMGIAIAASQENALFCSHKEIRHDALYVTRNMAGFESPGETLGFLVSLHDDFKSLAQTLSKGDGNVVALVDKIHTATKGLPGRCDRFLFLYEEGSGSCMARVKSALALMGR